MRAALRLVLLLTVVSLALLPHASRAGTPPADVGAYLQAGMELRTALAGRHGLVHQNMPGSMHGMEVRPDHAKAFDAGKHRSRVHDDGLAYAENDSVIVTTVLVGRREIDVILGHGGYDPHVIEGGNPQDRSWRGQAIEWQIAALSDQGIPTSQPNVRWGENLTPEARESRERELASQRGDAIKAQDDAVANGFQMQRQQLARVAGSRIRLVFDHDVPLADLTERALREILRPYLTLAD